MLAGEPNHSPISGMDARYMSVASGLTAERMPRAPTSTIQSRRGLNPSLLRPGSGNAGFWVMRALLARAWALRGGRVVQIVGAAGHPIPSCNAPRA